MTKYLTIGASVIALAMVGMSAPSFAANDTAGAYSGSNDSGSGVGGGTGPSPKYSAQGAMTGCTPATGNAGTYSGSNDLGSGAARSSCSSPSGQTSANAGPVPAGRGESGPAAVQNNGTYTGSNDSGSGTR